MAIIMTPKLNISNILEISPFSMYSGGWYPLHYIICNEFVMHMFCLIWRKKYMFIADIQLTVFHKDSVWFVLVLG